MKIEKKAYGIFQDLAQTPTNVFISVYLLGGKSDLTDLLTTCLRQPAF